MVVQSQPPSSPLAHPTRAISLGLRADTRPTPTHKKRTLTPPPPPPDRHTCLHPTLALSHYCTLALSHSKSIRPSIVLPQRTHRLRTATSSAHIHKHIASRTAPPAMPAWSSSTGKPQLSYADRLRHASKSSASPNHDSLSAAAASSSSSAFAPSSSHPPSATDASKHNASLIQRPDSTSTSPHTKQSPGNATTPAHAHAHPTSSTEATTAPSHASTTARNDAAPTLNVWEARRKQIAEREAEKSRERQQSPAHQRNDPPSSKASIATAASNPNHAATKHKLATAPLATAASSKKAQSLRRIPPLPTRRTPSPQTSLPPPTPPRRQVSRLRACLTPRMHQLRPPRRSSLRPQPSPLLLKPHRRSK